jgi:hypothetical protein
MFISLSIASEYFGIRHHILSRQLYFSPLRNVTIHRLVWRMKESILRTQKR